MIQRKLYAVKSDKLKPFILNYSLVSFELLSQIEEVEMKVPPLGFPVLIFYFGNITNFYKHKELTCQSVFVGQMDKHIMLYPSSKAKLLGVNFRPYGLYNLFGISPSFILNSGFESSLFFGEQEVNTITDKLKSEADPEEVLPDIEDLLLRFQQIYVRKQPFFDEMVDKILLEKGLIGPFSFLGKSSVRTFQRYFKQVVGIMPKTYCQLLRHKYILEQMYLNPDILKSELVLKGFYHDYSHFRKDFIRFSETPPIRYLDLKNNFASSLLTK